MLKNFLRNYKSKIKNTWLIRKSLKLLMRAQCIYKKYKVKFIRKNIRHIRKFLKLPMPVKVASVAIFSGMALAVGVVVAATPFAVTIAGGLYGLGIWAHNRIKKYRKVSAEKIIAAKTQETSIPDERQKAREKLKECERDKTLNRECLYENMIGNGFI